MAQLVTDNPPAVDTDVQPGDGTIDALVVERAIPVIDTVIRRRCRHWKSSRDESDDIRAEVVVRLLRRLRETLGSSAGAPIENFDAYVARIASRVIDDAIRLSRPEWARLKNRVRYLMTHDERFVLSIGEEGQPVCALRTPQPAGGARLRTVAAEKLAKAVVEVLAGRGNEMALDQLVSAIATATGLAEPAILSVEQFAFSAADPDAAVDAAETLRRLWSEIAALPPRQRAALLLNARDPAGESVLTLLSLTRLVPTEAVAAALDVSETELALLLQQLPLNDAVIADRVGVTVQQVINLRKAARDRLARRLNRPRRGN